MIFVFSQDDYELAIFETEDGAVQKCEGIDVEDGNYLFWDKHGYPLKPIFTTPNVREKYSIVSGKYQLQPSSDSQKLSKMLDKVSCINSNKYFSSVEEIRIHLESSHTKKSE